jgi:membrane protein required for colicin V production
VSLLDLLILVIVGVSVITGFVAGFARVGVGFLGLVSGILLGFWFYGIPASWFHTFIRSEAASNLLGFFLVFFLCLSAGGLLGKLMSNVFQWTGLTWADKTTGAFFGMIRGALIASAFVAVVMAFTPKPTPNWIVDSKLLPYAMGTTETLAALAPNSIKEAFTGTAREIREIWKEEVKATHERLTGPPAQNPSAANTRAGSGRREKKQPKTNTIKKEKAR